MQTIFPIPASGHPSRGRPRTVGNRARLSPRRRRSDAGVSAAGVRSATTLDRSRRLPSGSIRPGLSAPGRPYRTSFMSGVPDTDQLGDQCGALLSLDLDGHLGRHAHAVARHFLSIDDPLAQADARTRRHGTDEANFVGAVIDAPAPPGNLEHRSRHPGDQRERELTVGDRLAPGHLAPSPLDIHVDPLVVARGVGELVDHRLIDRDPLRGTQLAPDVPEELIRVLQPEHGPLPWRSDLAPGGYHPRHLPRLAILELGKTALEAERHAGLVPARPEHLLEEGSDVKAVGR